MTLTARKTRLMHRMQSLVCVLLILTSGAVQGREWPYYAADAKSSKYAPLSQIDGGQLRPFAGSLALHSPGQRNRRDRGYLDPVEQGHSAGHRRRALLRVAVQRPLRYRPDKRRGTVDLRSAVVERSGRFLGLCARHRLLAKWRQEAHLLRHCFRPPLLNRHRDWPT